MHFHFKWYHLLDTFDVFSCIILYIYYNGIKFKCLISILKHLLYHLSYAFKLKYIYIYISLLFSFVLSSSCVYALFAACCNTLYERI
jgi:hypothetical protein